MNKWKKRILFLSALLTAALAPQTAWAKDSGSAVLTPVGGSRNVALSVELERSMIENITSLHFQMYVSVENGAMSTPSFEFNRLIKEGIAVKDAAVSWDDANGDYIVDIILSGTQEQSIFMLDGAADGKAAVGTLILPEEDYYAQVGFVAADDAEDSTPELQYVDSAGAEAMTARLTNADPVYVGLKPQVQPEPEPEPEPDPVVPPQGESEQKPQDPIPTTPLPSDPIPEQPEDPSAPVVPETPKTQPETQPQTPEVELPAPNPVSPGTVPPKPETQPGVSGKQPSETQPAVSPQTEAKKPANQTEKQTEAKKPAKQTEAKKPAKQTEKQTEAKKPSKQTEKQTEAKKPSKQKQTEAKKPAKQKQTEAKKPAKQKQTEAKKPAKQKQTEAKKPAKQTEAKKPSKSSGKKDKSKSTAQTEPLNGIPAPKFTVKTVTGTRTLQFSWKRVAGAYGYQIFVYDAEAGRYKSVKNLKDVTSYSAEFSFGKTYKFRMRAFQRDPDKTKRYGSFSEAVKVRVPSFDKQKKVRADAVSNQGDRRLHFEWDRISGAEGYRIYQYDTRRKRYVILKTIRNAKTVRYTTSEKYATAGLYKFKMRAFAYDEDGEMVLGASSGEFQVITRPGKMSDISVRAVGSGQVRIVWKKVRGADGYQILRSQKKNGVFRYAGAVAGGNVLTYTDKKVTSGERYYYQVRAYKFDQKGRRKVGLACAPKAVKVR